jgi:hypothetical protein
MSFPKPNVDAFERIAMADRSNFIVKASSTYRASNVPNVFAKFNGAKGRRVMKIVLHLGAHRTATTTFQHYLRTNRDVLQASGLGFWGPMRTRGGLFAGISPGPRVAYRKNAFSRARGRVQLQLDGAADSGVKTLLISDENFIGNIRMCLAQDSLYPSVGERIARYAAAFDGRIDKVVLNIRALDLWWCSAVAFGVGRGRPLPRPGAYDTIAGGDRGWKDVITDIACGLPPSTKICVQPFETFAGRPDVSIQRMTGIAGPRAAASERLNKAPDLSELRRLLAERGELDDRLPKGEGRWHPFNEAQEDALRQLYADDMRWLSSGADGLATLTEDPYRERAQTHAAIVGTMTRGHGHGGKDGAMAHTG